MVTSPEVNLQKERIEWPSGTRIEAITPYYPKTLSLLTPAVTTNPIPMGAALYECEIWRIDSYLHGSATPSVTFKLFIGTDVAGTGLEVVVDGITLTTTTLKTDTEIDNPILAAGTLMWCHITAKSGTVNSVCIIPRFRLRG